MLKLGFAPIRWDNVKLTVLNQRALPLIEEYLSLSSVEQVADSISNLTLRGAPLIGVAAAYGLCLVENPNDDIEFESAHRMLLQTRPTAVNLKSAIDRMDAFRRANRKCENLRDLIIDEALRIHAEDADMCDRIGKIGNSIVSGTCRVLTHCNAGALATGGIGTALGVIYTAHFSGKKIEVWVCETRPVLQGSRLTAWELSKAGVTFKLITDSMAGHLMADGKVDLVITGADRIAANFDFANKIGTYSLAVLAKHHGIPFFAAAPSTTFDPACPDGKSIVIENRSEDEIRFVGESRIALPEAPVYNPAFDITPHELVTGIITEHGIQRP